MAGKDLKSRAKKVKLTAQYQGGFKGDNGKTYTREQGLKLLAENKASLKTWHSSKSPNKTSYEGTQYRGGRKEKQKNLGRDVEGNIVNQYGVTFTEAEKKQFENVVNKANYRRKSMLAQEGRLPRMKGGESTGQMVSQLQVMGKESDFILSRKSKSLQRFKSREEYENYLKNLERINDGTYLDERVKLYKRNHMKALENVFGDSAKDVIMKIRMMKPEDYMRLVQSDEDLEVSYIYDPGELAGRLNKIRASLNMKLKEEYMET